MRHTRLLCLLTLVSCGPAPATHLRPVSSSEPKSAEIGSKPTPAEASPAPLPNPIAVKNRPEPAPPELVDTHLPHGPGFEFNGKSIPPEAVIALMADLSESLPSIAALDLEGFIKNHDGMFSIRDGFVYSKLPEIDGRWGGYNAYRDLGATPSGTHVLEVVQSGGGSGVFKDLVFVRIEAESTLEQGEVRARHVLHYRGSFCLGDRDDGSVAFEGNRLVIGPSKYRAEETILSVE